MIRPNQVYINDGGSSKKPQQTTIQNLKRGDKGSEVSRMQQELVNAGYALDVDGSFGPKTESVLKQFQKDNGLAVDGIFGSHSASVLYGGKPATPTVPSVKPGNTESTGAGSTGKPSGTQQSQASAAPAVSAPAPAPFQSWEPPKPDAAGAARVSDAYNAAMAAIESAKAGSFTSPLDKTISDLYGQITGREPFRYSAADDPVYAQYAAMYARNGKQAMEDTMGQAAALTGGYGSSYAQAAGQSAYNAYMEKLNDVLPQLEQNAYARYQDQGEALLKQYQLAAGQRDDQYERWVNDRAWNYSLAQDAYQRYQDARDWQYKQDQDAYNKSVDERNWQYQLSQDAYGREQDSRNWEWKQAQDAYERYLDNRKWQYALEQDALSRQDRLEQEEYDREQDKLSQDQSREAEEARKKQQRIENLMTLFKAGKLSTAQERELLLTLGVPYIPQRLPSKKK